MSFGEHLKLIEDKLGKDVAAELEKMHEKLFPKKEEKDVPSPPVAS